MIKSDSRFAQILTEAVYEIRLRESKKIQIVQDELGYALGKKGGSIIEYWRKGHIPAQQSDVERLARELVRRGGLSNGERLEQFLLSADHPDSVDLCDELFPCKDQADFKPEAVMSRSLSHPKIRPDDSPLTTEFARFIVGPPIVHLRNFFGREHELKRIFDLWKRFPLQNVAVIGLQRSGKTSLLHYLEDITTATPSQLRSGQRTDWLPHPESYRWVLVDFQDARMCNQERLLKYLLTNLQMSVPDPCSLSSFMDVISHRLQTPTLILMDEIGVALASPELDQQFWWSLRSLASNQADGNLGFLLTSHKLPAQLAHEHGKPSPFFNIFGHTLTLGPLTNAEACDLINSSPRSFAPADVEWILVQSGRWPALLQILCHVRLTALESGETDDAWKQEGLRQMAPYRYLLDSQ